MPRAANAGVAMAGENGSSASQRASRARKRLSGLLRDGFDHLRSIPEEDAPAADVVQALENYGWERGHLGNLESVRRIEILARAAAQVTPYLPPNLRYPVNILHRLITWTGVLDASKALASGSTLQTIVRDKDRKRDLLLKTILRVRHHYCAASDEGEMNPELGRVGLHTHRAPANLPPLPDAPGTAVFQAATRQLSIPALPARASALVAWRKQKDGAVELAGISIASAVGVSNFSPLAPGVAYEMWATGRNASGDGPESGHVTFTA